MVMVLGFVLHWGFVGFAVLGPAKGQISPLGKLLMVSCMALLWVCLLRRTEFYRIRAEPGIALDLDDGPNR